MVLGVSRTAAVEFSFFLAIPTMIAATGYSLLKHGVGMSTSELMILIVGFITAFISALVVIRFFINFIKNHNFIPFAYYRIALAGLILSYFLIR
jgi:undecaprenyl-diphosphatase